MNLSTLLTTNICVILYERRNYFVRIKGERCAVSNQWYESINFDCIFDIISKELKVHGKLTEILDEYFIFVNIHWKRLENENESQFDSYRNINEEDRLKITIFYSVKFQFLRR